VGFDDGKPLGHGEMGGVVAAPIWSYFMERALAGLPVESFEVPPGVVSVRIDPKTGQPAGFFSSGGINEFFLEGSSPDNSVRGSGSEFKGGFRHEP